MKILRKNKYLILSFAFLVLISLTHLYLIQKKLKNVYISLSSNVIYDRFEKPISYTLNKKGYRAEYIDELPKKIIKPLLKKEDRFFYIHPGFNPASMTRALFKKITTGRSGGSSTITQQLVKNLLDNETNRTVKNKLYESFASIGLEIFTNKNDILLMYANTVYLGHGNQGFERASYSYFGKPLVDLDGPEIFSLLASLSSPHTQNPRTQSNKDVTHDLVETIELNSSFYKHPNIKMGSNFSTGFELQNLEYLCNERCNLSIDKKLTDDVRTMLAKHTERLSEKNVETGSVIIISVPDNKIRAIVGTPDPFSNTQGNAINMAIQPRPIGSTSKPFIYAKGFEAGLRPYTTINDREYRYSIQDDFSIYPRNFDGRYRGIVTLHEALSNSLNVPTVKVLEYITNSVFYNFLEHILGLKLLQTEAEYQFSAALGGLEIDPLTLAHLYTVFPNNGTLHPLYIGDNIEIKTPMGPEIAHSRKVLTAGSVQLVTALLKDRIAGVDQFGIKNNLSLPYEHYAVKTGTSGDFHDSWTIGYTPDFIVLVWLGNAQNQPLLNVTGASGAGALWHDVMQYMLNSTYNTHTPFKLDLITNVHTDKDISFGLSNEDTKDHMLLLADNDLIISPHDQDRILFDKQSKIPLRATEPVLWKIDGQIISSGSSTYYKPHKAGAFRVSAKGLNSSVSQEIIINIVEPVQ